MSLQVLALTSFLLVYVLLYAMYAVHVKLGSTWFHNFSAVFFIVFCDLWRLIQDGTMIIPVRLALVASSCTDKSVLAVQKDTPNLQRRLLTLGRYGVDP